MSYTENMSQKLAVVGKIDPVTTAFGTPIFTDVVDFSLFRRLLFVIQGGAIAGSATLDFAVYGSATSGGTYVAVPGAPAFTQLVTGDSNKVSLYEVRAESVNNSGFRYFKGRLNPLVANSVVSCVVLGTVGRNKPESLSNLAAVKQIVVY